MIAGDQTAPATSPGALVKSVAKPLAAPTRWKPKRRQREMLKLHRASNYRLDVRQACKRVGVHWTTFYGWFDSPAFVEWWERHERRHWAIRAPRVMSELYIGAVSDDAKGNPADRRAYLERVRGKAGERPSQAVAGAQVNVQVNVDAAGPAAEWDVVLDSLREDGGNGEGQLEAEGEAVDDEGEGGGTTEAG